MITHCVSDTTNGGPFGNGVMDPFQEAQARQPHVKDPYKLFGPICMELSNPGKPFEIGIVPLCN